MIILRVLRVLAGTFLVLFYTEWVVVDHPQAPPPYLYRNGPKKYPQVPAVPAK
jgi:hypothetical protein